MPSDPQPETIFKKDIAEYLYRRFPDHLKEDLVEVVDLVFQSIVQALKEGRRVEFRGLGSFSVHDQKGRVFNNPRNHVLTECPPSKRIVFKPSKDMVKISKPPSSP